MQTHPRTEVCDTCGPLPRRMSAPSLLHAAPHPLQADILCHAFPHMDAGDELWAQHMKHKSVYLWGGTGGPDATPSDQAILCLDLANDPQTVVLQSNQYFVPALYANRFTARAAREVIPWFEVFPVPFEGSFRCCVPWQLVCGTIASDLAALLRRPVDDPPPPPDPLLPTRLVLKRVCPRGMHWKGGRFPPPSSTAPSLCPATASLTPSASFNGICNRQ